jgi:hypothetical protein
MKKLSNLEEIILPKTCISFVYEHFKTAGEKGVECVALFAGVYISAVRFEITEAIVPAQKSYNLEGGLLYSVGEDELHRINVLLYERSLSLVAQIHTHPGRAYHSDTDDAYPIVAKVGGVSIVVPDFAFKPFMLKDWAVYRLMKGTGWNKINSSEVDDLIKIT